MFRKILIANRGEIACRVIRTARAMGIDTVAVFSDADAQALHVELADEAVRIGPPQASESYLNIERIIEAARSTGAEAIHPGYGFLSENADFADACEKAGIVFIGPPASAIKAMGLKGEAKRLMEQAKVPVVPGYHGDDQDEKTLRSEAKRIGFPVLIKAVAGGGGKGMRKVTSEKDFDSGLKSAKREAAGSFGNDRVLIEKFIEVPRHIEIQVFGDSHGGAVYLFERDCSLQRRHQKVVEEAPAPDLPEEMRELMGEAAVRAAKAIGYCGAGTVEFIVDVADGIDNAPFYFMEMNTRLQVEHPVTEMITGEDLVEWQLRIAAGDPLPLVQDDLAIDGHAMEVRLYAEDPDKDFLPASGTLTRFSAPIDEDFVRLDTGVRQGDAITTHYDPMIAKLVVWGEDRPAVLEHLRRALDRTVVLGTVTNLDFLRRIAADEDFAAGRVDTNFIDRKRESLMPNPRPASAEDLCIATLAILAARRARSQELAVLSGDPTSPWHDIGGWRPNLEYRECQSFIDETDTVREVWLTPGDDLCWDLTIDDNVHDGRLREFDDDRIAVEIDGMTLTAAIIVAPEYVALAPEGRSLTLKRLSARIEDDEDAQGPGTLTAPMPGKVLDVMVSEGDTVEKGQPMIVLEAMKMEHTLTAPRDGSVETIAASAGSQVADGDVLAVIAETEEE